MGSKLNSPGFRGCSCSRCPRRCVREPGALQLCLQLTPASHGLTLRGSSGAGPAVAADCHRVGVEGVDSRGTVGQLDRHLFGLIVGTDSMMGFDVGGFQNGLLSPQVENRKPVKTYHPVSFSWYHLSLQEISLLFISLLVNFFTCFPSSRKQIQQPPVESIQENSKADSLVPYVLVLLIKGFTSFLHLLEIMTSKIILINRAYRSGNQNISNPAVRPAKLESLICHLLETLENQFPHL